MTAARIPILLTCLAACLLLVTGCGGGGDKAAYEAGLKKMQGQLNEAKEASRSSGPDAGSADRKASLATAHKALDAAADTAAGLDPPKDATSAHRKLVSALRDYANLFGKLAQLKENDPAESELYSEAGQIVDRLDRANRALGKAGYRVNG